MAEILYAVGVGPGDPELLTLKAVRVMREADVIACPAKGESFGVAYDIAFQACPEIEDKEKLALDFPMMEGDISEAHRKAAESIVDLLSAGKRVVFLTLGDPGFYSTFSYISDAVCENGFDIEVVSGITSFCAVSAALKVPISLGDEAVLITAGEYRDFVGTLIIMKAGRKLGDIKIQIKKSGRKAYLVENCGMPYEKIYTDINTFPDTAGYFSILIVK
ncbi:MAG: precorrin-2 C(20)-methyltransferase [Lachnospiraceae bacterium]|nr:precorrin-2 C(20)-methyltransferase [Lachnospiraceae bacterium]